MNVTRCIPPASVETRFLREQTVKPLCDSCHKEMDIGVQTMMGWRARLGFLVPPGNPTVEPEMMQLVPPGVSLHFSAPDRYRVPPAP
jgi:hypothetical protein